MSRNERVSCESCTYYIYDEDYESYVIKIWMKMNISV